MYAHTGPLQMFEQLDGSLHRLNPSSNPDSIFEKIACCLVSHPLSPWFVLFQNSVDGPDNWFGQLFKPILSKHLFIVIDTGMGSIKSIQQFNLPFHHVYAMAEAEDISPINLPLPLVTPHQAQQRISTISMLVLPWWRRIKPLQFHQGLPSYVPWSWWISAGATSTSSSNTTSNLICLIIWCITNKFFHCPWLISQAPIHKNSDLSAPHSLTPDSI